MAALDYTVLNGICERAFYMALKMIDIANHERPAPPRGEPKVGGHPSACASAKHILTAIHLVCRNPEDYFAFKPHSSPMDHALNYLLHNFRDTQNKPMDESARKLAMKNLRHYSKEGYPVFQSYHAESDPDSFRYFPSGSVGVPPVAAAFTALGYGFAEDHGFAIQEDPRFWCLIGDSEFREGSLLEAMPDAGDRQLGRVIWIVDYNRQNLDGIRVANEKAFGGTDADRMCRSAKANGWNARILKHGAKRERLFAMPGGEEFRRVLDEEFTEFEYQALLESGRFERIRPLLESKSEKLKLWLRDISDKDLTEAYLNLAGHDLEILVQALSAARSETSQPTLLVVHTIKGHGLRCQAKSGNHSTLPEPDELAEIAKKVGASDEDPFAEFAAGSPHERLLNERRSFLLPGIEQIISESQRRRTSLQTKARTTDWPRDFGITALKMNPVAHTQWLLGQVASKLARLGRGMSESDVAGLSADDAVWREWAPFFMTMAPDVGTSTNIAPVMDGKLYGDIQQEDFELKFGAKDKKTPDLVPRTSDRTGHIRFEIAEQNCMSACGAIGKFGKFVGIPFLPSMTIYDFFIKRAHCQFFYNLYWKSSFMVFGTPSGVTLSSEGAQHCWKSDFQIPNCVTWEPCFAIELDWILAEMVRRHFAGENAGREGNLIRCSTKGQVQSEFLSRLRKQRRFKARGESSPGIETEEKMPALSDSKILETVRKDVLEGAYPLIDFRGYDGYVPGDNVVHVFALGALVAEAIKASDQLLEKGIFANVFVVTSPELLIGNHGHETAYRHLRQGLNLSGDLFLHPDHAREVVNQAEWLSLQGSRIPLVSVHDGEPGLLDNIGSVLGTPQKALAVRKPSKSGTTADIFHYHGIDAEAIVHACEEMLSQVAVERFRIPSTLLPSTKEWNGTMPLKA